LGVDVFGRCRAFLADGLGLTVHCERDAAPYASGTVVSDAEMTDLNLTRAKSYGEWLYTIPPKSPDREQIFRHHLSGPYS